MGSTYIVVSHVHLLDHVCDFVTGLCWLASDLTSSAGVVTSNQPRRKIPEPVSNHFSYRAICHVKMEDGPSRKVGLPCTFLFTDRRNDDDSIDCTLSLQTTRAMQ